MDTFTKNFLIWLVQYEIQTPNMLVNKKKSSGNIVSIIK